MTSHIWNRESNPLEVVFGKVEELQKTKEHQVYSYVVRGLALGDSVGKFVKTRWVLTEKSEDVSCRSVAQEVAEGDPRDDLVEGTPPLFVARLLMSRTASSVQKEFCITVLDISCAFLNAKAERTLYIELLSQDEVSSGEVGRLGTALYGARVPLRYGWSSRCVCVLVQIGCVCRVDALGSALVPGS